MRQSLLTVGLKGLHRVFRVAEFKDLVTLGKHFRVHAST